MGLVDHRQRISVTSDLLLGPVAGCGGLEHQRLDAVARRDDALDAVAGLGGLDDLAQGFQALGLLVNEELLPPSRLAQTAESRHLIGGEGEALHEGGVEGVHRQSISVHPHR